MDVMDAGRMAVVIDPSGAAVALWQASKHIGATLVNEPGAFIWNELITDDPKAAEFYTRVLGVTTSTMDMGTGEYTLFHVGGDMVGGTVPPPMAGVPNHWHVYFAVDDADATAARITGLGGSIVVEPFDSPVGRMAVARDPQGAMFSIIQPTPPESA
jgi:predicted enzyme related to lactoylglutathione lyase